MYILNLYQSYLDFPILSFQLDKEFLQYFRADNSNDSCILYKYLFLMGNRMQLGTIQVQSIFRDSIFLQDNQSLLKNRLDNMYPHYMVLDLSC